MARTGERAGSGPHDGPGFPRRFGPYVLLDRLGRGGMGEVFLAKQAGFAGIERFCVIKSIRTDLTDQREYVARFLDEARTVVQLAHRNIAQVFDVGAVGGQYYLAMEFVAGRDVVAVREAAAAQRRALSLAEALHVMGETLEALDYAHRLVDARTGKPLGLVHRDVSPQNVVVNFEGEVKLIDFGLARSTLKLERTEPGVVLGKLAYMAPEHARGDAVDGRADLFAVAVLGYELAVGARFYEGRPHDEVWQLAGRGGYLPPRLATLPPRLQELWASALAPNPKDRPASCGDLRAELLAFQVEHGCIGNAAALREQMRGLFPGDDDAERRRRTELAALPPPPDDEAETQRFAAAPSSGSEPAPSQARAEPTVLIARPTAARGPPREPQPRRRGALLAAATALAAVVGSVAAVVAWPDDPPAVAVRPDDESTDPDGVASDGAEAIEAAEAIGAAEDAAEPLDDAEPNLSEETEAEPTRDRRPPRRTTGRRAGREPKAAIPDEVPQILPLRVQFLAEHCQGRVTCAEDVRARFRGWAAMTPEDARTFKRAVDACLERCRRRG